MDLKTQECSSCDVTHSESEIQNPAFGSDHPSHVASKKRINRVKGQLDAVSRMIDERRYCPEIIYQIRAATNAMKALEQEVLRGHLKGCVKTAFQSRDSFEIEEKITEIMKLMNN